jgi:TPR repeat protein
MTKPCEHRTLRLLALLTAFGIGACGTAKASPHGEGADKPINVASTIAGCDNLDDCTSKCSEKNPNSCVSAGRLYEFGHGVAADPARAFDLYQRACDAQYAAGCYNAAVLLEAGKGVGTDLVRARKLYMQVCQMGSTTSCEQARRLGSDSKP